MMFVSLWKILFLQNILGVSVNGPAYSPKYTVGMKSIGLSWRIFRIKMTVSICLVSARQVICQAHFIIFPLGELETTGTPPYCVDEDYPARPGIIEWMKQLTWLRIIHSVEWCLRLVLRTHSGACQKWMNDWKLRIKSQLVNPDLRGKWPLEQSTYVSTVWYLFI